MPDAYSKNIVYLSQAQYQELITNNTITVNGVTVTYNENDIYVTPQAEPVTDVKINGSSIGSNGVANIPIASSSTLGVIKKGTGTIIGTDGAIRLDWPNWATVKGGTSSVNPITPAYNQYVAFCGLAKAAGVNVSSSVTGENIFVYPDDAKAAIQNMLGITDLISTGETSTATTAHAINSTFMMNGKLHRATTAIAIGDAVEVGTNCEVVKADEVFVKKTDIATSSIAGLSKYNSDYGITIVGSNNPNYGIVNVVLANENEIKGGTHGYKPIVPSKQHISAFYGLAKAAGDTTQSASSNVIGTYTTEAKAAIQSMLGIDLQSIASEVEIPLVETVTGTTPSIAGQPNTRYTCGEVSTISITPPASGTVDVIFESGSTAAVLTVPNTVKWPSWFDATALETNTIYEILITDGVYGTVMTWAT